MMGQDERMLLPASYAVMQVTESWSRLVQDWWRAQPGRLMDETAPWNFGLYLIRRMAEVTRPLALTEEERTYKVEAELPGSKPRNLDIRVTDGRLRISGDVDTGAESRASRSTGAEHFEREIPLPSNADAEKATAELHDGRLTVTMPKQPRPREHRVAVKPN